MSNRIESIEAGATRIAVFPRISGRIPLTGDQMEILKVQFNHCICSYAMDITFVLQLKEKAFLSPANAKSLHLYLDCHENVFESFTRNDAKEIVLKTSFEHELIFILPPGAGRFLTWPSIAAATKATEMTTKSKKMSKHEKAAARECARVAIEAPTKVDKKHNVIEEEEPTETETESPSVVETLDEPNADISGKPAVVETLIDKRRVSGLETLDDGVVGLEAPGVVNPRRESVMTFLSNRSPHHGGELKESNDRCQSSDTQYTYETIDE